MASFYLASRIKRIDEIVEVRKQLTQRGHEVTSRWIDMVLDGGPHANRDDITKDHRAAIAAIDLHDIRRADVLVLRAEDPDSGTNGGRFVEFGYAMGRHKELWVVGPLENLFLCSGNVYHRDNWDAFLETLDASDEARKAEQDHQRSLRG